MFHHIHLIGLVICLGTYIGVLYTDRESRGAREAFVRATRGSHVSTGWPAVQIFNVQEKPEEISFSDWDIDRCSADIIFLKTLQQMNA